MSKLLDAIAGFGVFLPFADHAKVGHFLDALERGLAFGIVHFLPAKIVGAPFHERNAERALKMLLEKWDVLKEELFLQILGAGGDHHPPLRQNRRDEIGQRFSGASACFDDEVTFVGEGGLYGFGHLQLAGAELVVRMPF